MKKQYLTIALLLCLLLILPLILIVIKQRQEIRPKAAFGTVNLALTPSTLTKNVGEEFEVEVQIIQPETIISTPIPTSPITNTPTPTITPGPTLTPTPTPASGAIPVPTKTRTPKRIPTLTLMPSPTPSPTITLIPANACNNFCQHATGYSGACTNTYSSYCWPGIGLCTGYSYCCCSVPVTPTPTPWFPGGQAKVLKTVHAQTDGHKISASDITLSFDKNILEVADVILPDSPDFTNLFLKDIKNDQGTVRFSVVANKPTDQLPSGKVVSLGKIRFKAKAPGVSKVTFGQTQIVGYNEQNEDVTLNAESKIEGNYKINELTGNEPKINFAIKFRGMQGIDNKYPDLKVRLRVIDENKVEEPKYDFEDIEVDSDNQKVYRPKDWLTLAPLSEGPNYTLLIKGPKHLQKRMVKRIELFKGQDERNNFNWTDESLQNDQRLDPGDLPPQDGVCNSHDSSRVLERYGSSKPEDLEIADLNYDGVVNAHDYSLILGTLETKYEDEE